MLRKQVVAFFLIVSITHADITSRYLLLPEKTWELGFAYFEDDERDYVFAIPFRYAFTTRLEFIPFGLKYLAHQGKENELALLTHISSLGYGSMNGWTVETTYGLIWRNKHWDAARIDIAPAIITEKNDNEQKNGASLLFSATHTFSPRFDLGIGASYRYDETDIDYNSINSQNDNGEETTRTLKSGLFFYYFFSDTFNIRSGFYHVNQDEAFHYTPGYSYKKSSEHDTVSARIDWRF